MTDTSLALQLRLAKFAAPDIDLDDAERVLETLSTLGYSLVADGADADEFVSVGQLSYLANDLSRRLPDVRCGCALTALERMNYRIKKPTKLEIAKQ